MDPGSRRHAIVTEVAAGSVTKPRIAGGGARVLIAGRTADKINRRATSFARKTAATHAAGGHDKKPTSNAWSRPRKLGGVDILVNNAGTMYSAASPVLDDNELNQLERN